jgi:Flp pilus assembly protein TadG
MCRLQFIFCDRASQIVELAVTAPLLVAFVVGIYDFGQALNTKEKLNFAAKDGAKFAATQPTNDLSQTTPLSVVAIRDLVDSDLIAAGLSDCALGPIQSAGLLVWAATGSCGNDSPFTLTINRGFVVQPSAGASNPVQQISTYIGIQYPYRWHLGRVIQLVAPGASFAGTTLIPVDAIAANQD